MGDPELRDGQKRVDTEKLVKYYRNLILIISKALDSSWNGQALIQS